jgi:hypothetical protein
VRCRSRFMCDMQGYHLAVEPLATVLDHL